MLQYCSRIFIHVIHVLRNLYTSLYGWGTPNILGDQILHDMPPHVQIFEGAKLGRFYENHELLGHPAGISLALVALYVTLKRKHA